MFLCHWNKAPYFVFNFTMYIIEKKNFSGHNALSLISTIIFSYVFISTTIFFHNSLIFHVMLHILCDNNTSWFKPDIYPFGIFKYFLYNNIICFPSRKVTFQSVISSSVITGLWVILLRPLHFRSMQTASIIALLWLKSSPLLSLNKR